MPLVVGWSIVYSWKPYLRCIAYPLHVTDASQHGGYCRL